MTKESPEKIYHCEIPLGDFLPEERTIGDLLADRAKKFSSQTLLLERSSSSKEPEEFSKYSWAQLWREIRNLGTAFIREGISPGDRVALLSHNQKDMFTTVMALYSIGAINVPIFFGYFSEQVNFILQHSGAKFLIAADDGQIVKISKKNLPDLEKIFCISAYRPVQGLPLFSFQSLATVSGEEAEFQERIKKTQPQDTCAIMYTSGTTGTPKGVELSHANFISQQKAFSLIWDLGSHHRLLSYLPWHHCFGGIFETFMAVYFGIPMALDGSRGKDFSLLTENWRKIKPTCYLSVPAVYQTMIREMEKNPELAEVFFHPELEFVFTAAAPLPPDIYAAYQKRGIPVHEGWGLTEASPDITLTRPNHKHSPGIVGQVIPGVAIKLGAEGEILARGPNIMKGYYRNAEATRKVLDDEGWLQTGDLGELTPEGLRIVGRMDGVFKLINGEKIPSAYIEGLLVSGSSFVDRVVVCGRGQEFVCALLFCNEKALTVWAKEKGFAISSFAELLQRDEVRALMLEDVRKTNQKMVEKFYRIHRFYLVPRTLSLEWGEITPTAKTCRHRVLENFQKEIREMFQNESTPAPCGFIQV